MRTSETSEDATESIYVPLAIDFDGISDCLHRRAEAMWQRASVSSSIVLATTYVSCAFESERSRAHMHDSELSSGMRTRSVRQTRPAVQHGVLTFYRNNFALLPAGWNRHEYCASWYRRHWAVSDTERGRRKHG